MTVLRCEKEPIRPYQYEHVNMICHSLVEIKI